MSTLLWIFFCYAFWGWCAEVCYAALTTGRFVNRGFLNSPLCPIYGFGVVLVLTCLEPLRDSLPLLFLGSMALTSLLEGLAGFLLEKLFGQRWWDYSDERFNLGGYICLRFSLAWGLACLLVVKVIHPAVLFFIAHLPATLSWVLLALMLLSTLVDLAATVADISHMNRRLDQIDALAAKMREGSNDLGERLADRVLEAAERGADLREDLSDWQDDLKEALDDHREELEEALDHLKAVLEQETAGQRRLLSAFPKMRSLRHHRALGHLRRHMEHKMKKVQK